MCYNIATSYTLPPEFKVRWARIELANRLHGSAVQKHRVCPSTTSALPSFFYDTPKTIACQWFMGKIHLNLEKSCDMV